MIDIPVNTLLNPGKPPSLPANICRARLKSALIIALALSALGNVPLSAQDRPEPVFTPVKKHSVRKAAVYSAMLPGLGQVYNRKAWKVPIIYAGFGVLTYFIVSNHNQFILFKEAYIYKANGETYPTDNEYALKYNLNQLSDGMEYYRRNRDLSYIIAGIWYTMNILEAYVDAHFFDYDISEDLTMGISPAIIPMVIPDQPASAGITLSFKFKP